jgi:hypothetical protein
MIALVLSAFVALANPVLAADAAPSPAASPVAEDPKITERVKTEFTAWQRGELVRAHYSQEANQGLNDTMVAGMSEHLKPLGAIKSTVYQSTTVQGGNTAYAYRVNCEKGDVLVKLVVDKLGKIGGISFRPADKIERNPAT